MSETDRFYNLGIFFRSAINCWKMKGSKNIISLRLILYCSFSQNQNKTGKKIQTEQKLNQASPNPPMLAPIK